MKTIKSEYLSRSFALDLKAVSRSSGSMQNRANRSTRGFATERATANIYNRPHPRPLNLPPWHGAPKFEGVLSMISRGDVPLSARGRLEGDMYGKGHPAGMEPLDAKMSGGITIAREAIGAERIQTWDPPSSARMAALRNETSMHSGQVRPPGTCVTTKMRLHSQSSLGFLDTETDSSQ